MRFTFNYNRALQIFTGIGLLTINSCSPIEKKDAAPLDDTVALVAVSRPVVDSRQSLTISGQVEAVQSANISTKVMGYITKIYVKVGDLVSKGQLLATIDSDDILAKRAQAEAMITEAEAGYKNAEKDHERFMALYKQQSASAKELDDITLQYSSAKARLAAAKQMRNEVNSTFRYTNLTAPFPGTVTKKMMDAGNIADPGMPLMIIEQDSSYRASASVSENEVGLIRKGAAVTMTISAINKVLNGRITQIDRSSTNTGGQYIVKVRILQNETQGLLTGMYANLIVPVTQKINGTTTNGQVMVPVSAIEYKDQLTGLYTIGNNHTALLRWVRLGKTQGDQVEVLSGLSENEQFIVSAEGRLYNGAAVKIK